VSIRKARWKRFANLAGAALALIGLTFVVIQLRRYGASVDTANVSPGEWMSLCGLILVGVGMNACLGVAWRSALADGGAPVSMRWGIATYALTHVARYVPGNIFHYAGRQAVGMAAGLSARSLARASLLELALVAMAGALLSLLALPLVFPLLMGYAWIAFVVLLLGSAIWVVYRTLGRALTSAFMLYLLYLSLSGTTFLVVVLVHAPHDAEAGHYWIALCAAYVAAWLIGMLTPGAPAGLGVREIVILFLLQGSMDAATLLFAVLATRVIAIGADTAAWVVGCALRRNTLPPEINR